MYQKITLTEREIFERLRKLIPKDEFDELFQLSFELTQEILAEKAIIRLLFTDCLPSAELRLEIRKWKTIWKK